MKTVPVKTLDELVESGVIQLTRGKIISKTDMAAYPGSFPVYSSAKENDGKFGEYGRYMFDEELITWSVDGGGRLFYRPTHKFSVTNVGGVLRIRDKSVLDYKYLYYVLSLRHSEIMFDWVKKAHPSVIKKLYQDIPVPPLPEQRRIVGILDEAFEGIATAKANAEKNLHNARALFESHLQSVFTQRGPGWVEKRLFEVATSISTGPFGTMLHKSDYVLDGIPLVNPMNIVDSTIVPSSKMMVNTGTRDRLSAYVLKAGDVVVGRRGELGRCALVTEREAGWLCGTGSFFVRLSDAMDGKFFVALFGSEQFKARLEASAVGTTMSSLNHGILNDLVLPVPPLVEQRKIMEKAQALLAETQRLASLYDRKLAALEALKKSLLHQAFTGEL